jgi:DNA-binding Lrp family transcriptional regulator
VGIGGCDEEAADDGADGVEIAWRVAGAVGGVPVPDGEVGEAAELVLRDLPATAAVQSWTSYDLLKVFPAGFAWSAGLLTQEESAQLWPGFDASPEPLSPLPEDDALIDALIEDSRMTYEELAGRTGKTPRTVRRRLDALVEAHAVRLATEVDLALLGVHAEALLWIKAMPGALQETGQILSRHPRVRFTAATTGSSSLLVAVAAADLSALYAFLTGTVGPCRISPTLR